MQTYHNPPDSQFSPASFILLTKTSKKYFLKHSTLMFDIVKHNLSSKREITTIFNSKKIFPRVKKWTVSNEFLNMFTDSSLIYALIFVMELLLLPSNLIYH